MWSAELAVRLLHLVVLSWHTGALCHRPGIALRLLHTIYAKLCHHMSLLHWQLYSWQSATRGAAQGPEHNTTAEHTFLICTSFTNFTYHRYMVAASGSISRCFPGLPIQPELACLVGWYWPLNMRQRAALSHLKPYQHPVCRETNISWLTNTLSNARCTQATNCHR
jgi:hypothetical protein